MRIPLLDRLSFTWQFVVLSLSVLLIGMLTIGFWVSSSIEQVVINRTAGVTALYVDSFVTPLVQGLSEDGELTGTQRADLDRLITGTRFGTQIVSFKIWSRDGEILYSPNPEIIGRTYAMDDHLRQAFDGEVTSEISDLSEPENEYEASSWETLIETYAPVRNEGSDQVVLVSEFYQLPDRLQEEIRSAQIRGWIIVAAATVIMHLLLVGMMRRASNTIRQQRSKLVENVEDLRMALDHNQRLRARVDRAAARTTTLNERFLRRVSADIHDGPAQDVALALLRIEAIDSEIRGNGAGSSEDVDRLRAALESALADLRAISHGLRMPEVDQLTPCEAARRATADYERISGEGVQFECHGESVSAPAPVNITVYRVVQEALANSHKHAGQVHRRVAATATESGIEVTVSDEGAGFELDAVAGEATLGLEGMRERVELLSGTLDVQSTVGEGTVITAVLPLHKEGPDA